MKAMAKATFQSAGLQASMMLLALVFIQMLVSENLWIRIPASIVIAALFLFIAYISAAGRGERDCVLTERNERARAQGETVSADQEQAGYQSLRGFLTALFGGIFIFAVLLIIAVIAHAFYPLWKTVGAMFYSIMNIYLVPYIGFMDLLRSANKALEIVAFVLLPLLFIAATGIGYQQGPRRRAKVQEVIAGARDRFDKKQKQEKREAKKKLAQEKATADRQKKG